MKSRTIAIAASIAALSFAAAPLAQASTDSHSGKRDAQLDKSGARHLDKSKDGSKDRNGRDSRDFRDR